MYSAQPNSVDSATINPAALASPGKFLAATPENVIHEPSRPLRCAGSASGPGRAALLLRCPILHPLPHLHHLLLHHHSTTTTSTTTTSTTRLPTCAALHSRCAPHRVNPSSRLVLSSRSHPLSFTASRTPRPALQVVSTDHVLMLMRCLAQIYSNTAPEVSRESGRQTPIKRRRLGMTVCCDSIFVYLCLSYMFRAVRPQATNSG